MGYTTRNNGNIKDYWPDDTENCFYITADSEPTISDLLEMAVKKWGDSVTLVDLKISAENIHTSCLTYDLHDPSDYTVFIVIAKEN